MKKKVAVISASGIGDGLMMMICAFALHQHEKEVVFYHAILEELNDWFFPLTFKPQSLLANLDELSSYDWIILQNDNSEKAKRLMDHFQHKKRLSILYPSYEKTKHPPITENDIVFNGNISMTQNICSAMQHLLNDTSLTLNNGIKSPTHLSHRKYMKRVIIHPTSTVKERTWAQHKFLQLAKKLHTAGFEPVLVVSKQEYPAWVSFANSTSYQIKYFPSLSEMAAYIYESGYFIGNESGLSHLSSNLHLPNLVIAGNAKRIKLWRPGWLDGKIITPPGWIPNIKGLRIRENHWQAFISPNQVVKIFLQLCNCTYQ